jgi:hopene-associated glycosyltransferase HpnB
LADREIKQRVDALMIAVIAALPVLIWLYLLACRGRFWRADPAERASVAVPEGKRVIVVIPARNEAALIGATITSLARQNFAGAIECIVVDDGSTDGTAEAAAAAARASGVLPVRVIRGEPLPRGWTGKLWAQAQGVAAARELQPDFLLFTDADIEHGPASVGSLVADAEVNGRDLVSRMVRLSTAGPAARLLIPAFVFFFFKLYPPAWVAAPRRRVAAAAGGCILIRPEALERLGGLATIRSQIIDDCALARAVKHRGGRISLALAGETRSLRRYASAAEIGAMISRTAFAQLGHSYLLLGLTLAGMFVTYLLPVTLLFVGNPLTTACAVGALLLMSACYWPMVRFYRLAPFWCLCLPLIATFYTAAVVHSALQYARGRGGSWKGRAQDV